MSGDLFAGGWVAGKSRVNTTVRGTMACVGYSPVEKDIDTLRAVGSQSFDSPYLYV
jgi:hypothetical protein